MRRLASAAPGGRRVARRSEEFSRLNEIALADRGHAGQALPAASLRLLRLQTGWARAVGAPLREVARLRACAGERLVVDVPDATWKAEMDRLKPAILERLAREVPCAPPVSDLSFLIRPATPPPPVALGAGSWGTPAPSPPKSSPGPLPEALSGALSRVGDEDLRGRLGRVMGRYLSRKPSAV
jgi:hypothetical protein